MQFSWLKSSRGTPLALVLTFFFFFVVFLSVPISTGTTLERRTARATAAAAAATATEQANKPFGYLKAPISSTNATMDFARVRAEMVVRTIKARGIKTPRVLEALNSVKREEFVPERLKMSAYEDNPLPIGAGQTISQPYIVALMVDAMKINPSDKVLDVGTGCGYAAAVMAHLAKEVYSIERIAELADTAKERLHRLGYKNIHVQVGDGSIGLPEQGPFDVIAVAASSPQVPNALVDQLAEGGRIVIPIENAFGFQDLLVGTKQGDKLKVEDLGGVRFVPLIGAEGHMHPA